MKRAEPARQKTEDRRQKTEDRKQKIAPEEQNINSNRSMVKTLKQEFRSKNSGIGINKNDGSILIPDFMLSILTPDFWILNINAKNYRTMK